MRGGIVNSFIAASGSRTEVLQTTIDASLAAISTQQEVVLYNMGANDIYHDNGAGGIDVGLPLEADWKADTAYILDAIHAHSPAATIYAMDTWVRVPPAAVGDMATLKTWRAAVLATRGPWAVAGPDEDVFLENGDNGVTYTSDGVHPNAAGNALTALQWEALIGGP